MISKLKRKWMTNWRLMLSRSNIRQGLKMSDSEIAQGKMRDMHMSRWIRFLITKRLACTVTKITASEDCLTTSPKRESSSTKRGDLVIQWSRCHRTRMFQGLVLTWIKMKWICSITLGCSCSKIICFSKVSIKAFREFQTCQSLWNKAMGFSQLSPARWHPKVKIPTTRKRHFIFERICRAS